MDRNTKILKLNLDLINAETEGDLMDIQKDPWDQNRL